MQASKKRLSNLIILLLVLVILVVAYIFVTPLFNQEEKEDDSTKDTSVSLCDIQSTDFKSISFSVGDSSLTFNINSNLNWELEGDKDFPVNQSLVSSFTSFISSIKADKEITNSDLTDEEIGLDDPQYTITVVGDGTSFKLSVGNLNDFSAQYYVKVDGNDKIYMSSSAFSSELEIDVLNWIQYDEIPYMTVDNVEEYTVKTYSGEKTFSDEDQIDTLSSIYLSDCINYKPTDEELTYYLFGENDVITITVPYTITQEVQNDDSDVSNANITKEYTFTLKVGGLCDGDDTLRYVMVNDSQIVYSMPESYIDSLTNETIE